MSEQQDSSFEDRSRALFQDSVDGLDMRVRSRLTQARAKALEAASISSRRPWLLRASVWTPAAGVTAAAVLGVALWFGSPLGQHAIIANDQTAFDDLDIVASSDDAAGDNLDMLQDDLDFYAWADKAGTPGPQA